MIISELAVAELSFIDDLSLVVDGNKIVPVTPGEASVFVPIDTGIRSVILI